MLHDDGNDIRSLLFSEQRLVAKFPDRQPRVFVTDLLYDGPALWDWVNDREWEGIISMRLDSPYVEGKKYRYWYKKRGQDRSGHCGDKA
jgi:bifunctional non-homologous end joining protein LigD